MIDLSLLVGSINPMNVWDLPLWAWRSYAAFVDDRRRQVEEESRGR